MTPRGFRAATLVLALAIVAGPMPAGPAAAPRAEAAHTTVAAQWNETLLEAVRNSTLGPPMVARALAIAHTCMYDAWAAYDILAVGTQHGGALRRPLLEHTEANKAEAISYAAHRAGYDLFPGHEALFDATMLTLGFQPTHDPPDSTSPAGIGNTACASVLAFRHHDASNQLGDLSSPPYSDYTGYEPVNDPMVVAEPIDPDTVHDPNRWQPLVYDDGSGEITQTYLGAHWGYVVPFGMTSGSQFRSLVPPPEYGKDAYTQEALEVLQYSAELTDRHKVIAEYWEDGPSSEQPPGHWNLFAQFVAQRDEHTLDQDVKLFFVLNNAVMDAAIAAWDDKRHFDYVRPITAIRYLFDGQEVSAWGGVGQGTQTIDGGTWLPYQREVFPTPPFAEYVSGHSTFSAAGAQVLKLFTGSDHFGYAATFPAGSSRIEPGITPEHDVLLTWPTFSDAADEAGISRLYGGIHFSRGNEDGGLLGREVGTTAWLEATAHFLGLAL